MHAAPVRLEPQPPFKSQLALTAGELAAVHLPQVSPEITGVLEYATAVGY